MLNAEGETSVDIEGVEVEQNVRAAAIPLEVAF